MSSVFDWKNPFISAALLGACGPSHPARFDSCPCRRRRHMAILLCFCITKKKRRPSLCFFTALCCSYKSMLRDACSGSGVLLTILSNRALCSS